MDLAPRSPNGFLSSLTADDFELVRPHLRTADLSQDLVLVEVDFPQGKKLPKKVVEQNEKLQKEHGVRGYPTIVVLNPEGKKVGQLGYMEGGPKAFLAKLDELKGK